MKFPENPTIASCELVKLDLPDEALDGIVDVAFGALEEKWDDIEGGSPVQSWYRSMADRKGGTEGATRLIAWKNSKAFLPENIFFRTLDTGRLTPLKDNFKLHFYAHKSHWAHLNASGKRLSHTKFVTVGIIHEILLLRSMHDLGCRRIPVIVSNWSPDQITGAMDYWVSLSKNEWNNKQRNAKYNSMPQDLNLDRYRSRPCFLQTDLLVRSLLSDPAAGYVPPFIIFYSTDDNRGRVLFTDTAYVPDASILISFPRTCGAPSCDDEECGGFFDLTASRALAPNSKLVRSESAIPKKRVLCNDIACNKTDIVIEGDTLKRCQRCKEARYCSKECQASDWASHKLVCEKREI